MWTPINSSEAIDRLFSEFHDFDDSCLREAALSTGTFVHDDRGMTTPVELDTSIRLFFQSQSADPSGIELKCERVLGFSFLASPAGHISIISSASLIADKGSYRFALKFIPAPFNEPADANDSLPATPQDPDIMIVAEAMAWRPVHNHLGAKLLYRHEEN